MAIFDYLYNIKEFNEIIDSNVNKTVSGTNDGLNQLIILSDFYKTNRNIFVILPDLYQAQKYYDSILDLATNEDDVLFYPQDEVISANVISSKGDLEFERIMTIMTLLTSSSKHIVVTNIHGALKYVVKKDSFLNSFINVKVGSTFNIDELLTKLVNLGYKRVYTTTKTAEFSRRGEILDIFPFGYTKPIRIDFFDDEVETLKEFDVETQRSDNKIDSFNILPVTEFIYTDHEYDIVGNQIRTFVEQFQLSPIEDEMYTKDLENLRQHNSLDTLSRYTYFFNLNGDTILDLIDDKKIYLIDKVRIEQVMLEITRDVLEYSNGLSGTSFTKLPLLKPFKEIEDNIDIAIEGLNGIGLADIKFNVKSIVPYRGKKDLIANDLKTLSTKCAVVLFIKDEKRINNIKELMDDNNINYRIIESLNSLGFGTVNIINAKCNSIYLLDNNIIFLSEEDIFDLETRTIKGKYKSIYKNATKVSSYQELEIGDYVVSYEYGIGIYNGIKTKEVSKIKRDYIEVIYKNNSSLFIPLEKISNLMKYAPRDQEGVEINEIGSSSWEKTKLKLRKRVHDISDKLIKIYAERHQAKGFKFLPDTDLQKEFEEKFEYELTPDQQRTILEVKNDMESDKPMDRLVCGDVGYGKTEVALRAAFKAVMSGKQVAVLAPTTILARQHYQTFNKRMEEFGVTVKLLSRFVKPKEQKETIEGIKRGNVDIVIGTHRLLSNEIVYHDLGLLVVDEEQRFGVTHKEKIKALKVNVDCITLSATPIPRTLQMSVMGLKDLSMIETPPKNRYPVQTYVIERSDRIIVDAITRELSRGGQVFYLYNWTETILDVASKLKSLIPYARIGVGHGKLSRDELENVLTDYIDKKYDILLCTTIIETGLDMPNTNTLIIHDADRLGLSQLYQIRGRVGRSSKIAYAYLMYEPRKKLTPEAEKRLQTIKEFNELGSGFKIAMRDLSIRGSGDLLGEEQSGFVESVGIDMYLKILDEEINHKPVKEENVKVDSSMIKPLVDRTIDPKYIESEEERIKLHKKIDELSSMDSYSKLIVELEDRFGKVNLELRLYMLEKTMNNLLSKIGVYKKATNDREVTFIIGKEDSLNLNGNIMFENLPKNGWIKLSYINYEIRITLSIYAAKKEEAFKLLINYIELIISKDVMSIKK